MRDQPVIRPGRSVSSDKVLAEMTALVEAEEMVGRARGPAAATGLPGVAHGWSGLASSGQSEDAVTKLGGPWTDGQQARHAIYDSMVALRGLVAQARHTADIGGELPPMHQQQGLRRQLARFVAKVVISVSRFLLRDQRTTNQATLTAVEHAADALERLAIAVGNGELATQGRVTAHLQDAEESRIQSTAALGSLQQEVLRLGAAHSEGFGELLRRLEGEREERAALARKLGAARLKLRRLEPIRAQVAQLGEVLDDLTRTLRRQDETMMSAETTATLMSYITGLQAQVDHLRNYSRGFEDASLLTDDEAAAESVDDSNDRDAVITSDEAGRRLAQAYAAFEGRFRGSKDLILHRLREAYATRLEYEANCLREAGTHAPRWIDLGCGRGEWLSVIEEAGYDAHGVDLNEGMLAEARAAGRSVQRADAIEYLRHADPRSIGGISALHVVEHLPYRAIFELLLLARRAVVPGGLLILETPNPENLNVGAHTFHLDPTHRRPVPPELLGFLTQQAGWELLDLPRMHADDGEDAPVVEALEAAAKVPGDSMVLSHLRRVDRLLFGPRDYAVIARRPSE